MNFGGGIDVLDLGLDEAIRGSPSSSLPTTRAFEPNCRANPSLGGFSAQCGMGMPSDTRTKPQTISSVHDRREFKAIREKLGLVPLLPVK